MCARNTTISAFLYVVTAINPEKTEPCTAFPFNTVSWVDLFLGERGMYILSKTINSEGSLKQGAGWRWRDSLRILEKSSDVQM